jgi:TrmH family RNA methyltransferase
MYIDNLSSAKNPKIKEILLLSEKSKERRERALFVVEGKREIEAALIAGYKIYELFLCTGLSNILNSQESASLEKQYPAEKNYTLTEEVYSKVAYRGGTEGVIAIFRYKTHTLKDISLSSNPLIIVLESVEKPGNLGAVLRTADAANADAVIVCDPLTDLFNPNIIRSSIGGVFTNKVCISSSEETYKWLTDNNIKIFAAQLQDAELYYNCDMSGASAVVMGTESLGLKPFWRERAHHRIKIPMLGSIDSLNVSVSAAVICFEALRQREFRK